MWGTVHDAVNTVRAAAVLHRRGMVNVWRPREALRANAEINRFGAFGGLAVHTAARYGDRPALTDPWGTMSFLDLDDWSNALARVLRSESIADRKVGLLSRGHRGLLLGLMAAGKAGIPAVLLNTGFSAPQLADVCARERVGVVLADSEFADLIDTSTSIAVVRFWSGPAGSPGSVEELIAATSSAPPPVPRHPGSLVLLTSGTTGTPKGAARDRVKPVQSAQLLDRIPWPSDSAYCVAAPMFHATGLATATVGLALGNRLVLSGTFDPKATIAAVAEYRVGALIVVPTMLSRILALGADELRRHDTSSLRVIFAAGSALSPDLCRRTTATFGDVLYNLYGSTEVATAAVATPADLRAAPGTVGRPPIGCRIAAFDDTDRRITKAGQVGTLYVSSGLSFPGYTDGGGKKILDGMLSSGDTGHFDAAGRWFVDGRADDMIVSGGENVYPVEVENLINELPEVSDVAVVGVADADFGKRLCAYVVRTPGAELDGDRVRAFVRSRLARFKVPRDVVFIEALPRNETGKVLKNRLAG